MDDLSNDMIYQILALSMKQEGAVEYFHKNLSPAIVERFGRGHGELYKAILTFYEKTGVEYLDRVGFTEWMKNETRIIEALGGEEVFDKYVDYVLSVPESRPETVASILRYEVDRAEQLERIKELQELSEDPPEDYADKVSSLTREIDSYNATAINPLKTVYDGSHIASLADSLWELPDFMATPFPSLNKAMAYSEKGGFCKGAVHAVLAQSGLGKSTFAKTLMLHWVEKGNTCMYVNYEEARPHWERILFTQVTKQNVYQAQHMPESERKKYTQSFQAKLQEWDGRFLVKHDPDTPYFEDMENWVREIVSKGTKLDVLFIDTIQSMFLKGGRNQPRWGQFEEMMVRLEKLAKDLECVVIITAQENSNRMKEKREVVQQSDIGGSLAIAQKCSVAIFLTKAKTQMGDDSIDESIMQLQIPKNRITGVVSMMDPPLVRYNDNTKSYEEFTLPPASEYDASTMPGQEDMFEPY